MSTIKQTTEAIDGLSTKAKEATNITGNLRSAIQALGKGMTDGRTGFDDMITAATSLSEALSKTGEISGGLLAKIPVLEGLGGAVSNMSSLFGDASKALTGLLGGGTKEIIETLDAFSKPLREADEKMMGLTKSFGLGIEAARELTAEYTSEALTSFSKSANISTGELIGMMEATKRSNISLDTLTSGVKTAYGELDLFTAATVQAGAAGIQTYEASRILETAIAKQGMSAQSASEMMAGFSEVARETGISFMNVSNTLSSAVSQFSKIGMSADFGRPILESFAKTVKEVGLGIDVATESTMSLVSAMGRLSDNYGLAYLTKIRGGMGESAGGVLGASIEMRQNLREAKETGDQGSIAIEMAKQIKETIASMTGGNIITLDEAASSPELQSQFYMQGQMLSQYGITDTSTQDVVLDLLSKIDKAKVMGDNQGQEELAKQLSMEIENRDESMDEMSKLNISIGSYNASLMESSREFVTGIREISEMITDHVDKIAEENILKIIENMVNLPEINKDSITSVEGLLKTMKDGFKELFIDAIHPDVTRDNDESNQKSMVNNLAAALKEAFSKQVIKIEMSDELRSLIRANPTAATMNVPSTSP